MNIIDIILKFLLNCITRLLQITRFGSGTALPGKLIEESYPQLLVKLSRKYKEAVFITGTNGKTSVTSMVASMYKNSGYFVTTNSEGSNMMRGIISTMIKSPHKIPKESALILEVEEGTMHKISKYIKPNYIIVTNVFRDQLDAYGEISRIRDFIKTGITNCEDATVIYNINDPLLREMMSQIENKKVPYGLSKELNSKFKYENLSKVESEDELAKCLIKFINSIDHVFSQTVTVQVENDAIQYELNLTGIYNILNSLATFTLGMLKNIEIDKIVYSLEKVEPSFGRGERIIIPANAGRNKKQIEIRLFLAKNPAGYEQILEVLKNEPKSYNLPNCKHVFVLNDNIADSRDVSWIWDIDFSKINLKLPSVICSGVRAEDMALRLKYAEVSKSYIVTPDIEELIEDIIDNPSRYRVVCTYTAMIEFRKLLRKYISLPILA
jgi:UDP-N-acetylmuramyl tripeptide synthase